MSARQKARQAAIDNHTAYGQLVSYDAAMDAADVASDVWEAVVRELVSSLVFIAAHIEDDVAQVRIRAIDALLLSQEALSE